MRAVAPRSGEADREDRAEGEGWNVSLFRILLVEADEDWAQKISNWFIERCSWPAARVQVCLPEQYSTLRRQALPDVTVWDIVSAGLPVPEGSEPDSAAVCPVLYLVEQPPADRMSAAAWVRRDGLDAATFAQAVRELLESSGEDGAVPGNLAEPPAEPPTEPAPAAGDRSLAEAASESDQRVQSDPAAPLPSGVADELFRNAFVQLPAGMAVAVANGPLLFVNPGLAGMLGYAPDELVGRSPHDLVYPEDLTAFRALLSSSTVGQNRLLRLEVRLQHRDGDAIWAEMTAHLEPGTEDRPSCFLMQFLDVRAHREAEDVLRRSEQWFRALVEHSSDTVVLVGDNGRIRYASQSIHRMLGYTPADLVGREALSLVHPADVAENTPAWMRVLRAPGAVAFGTFRVTHQQGTWRWLEGVGSNQLQEPGVGGIVFNLRDVTERRHATKILQRQALIVANLTDAILVMDTGQKIVDCNSAAVRLFGYDRDELVGRLVSIMHSPDDARALDGVLSGDVLSDRPQSVELGFLRKDGSGGVCELTLVALRDRQGEPHGTVAVYHDISERKRVAEDLARSERRYRGLFLNANDAIFSTDFSGTITEMNPKAEIVFNRRGSEHLQTNLMELLADDGRRKILDTLEQLKKGLVPPTLELELIQSPTRKITLEINAQLLVEEGEPRGMQAIGRDVTDRIGLETQLRQSQKMEALGRLAGGVAHDFNNLLTVIGGYGEYLQEELRPEDPLCEATREIARAVERASGLTRQMLAFSRQQVLRPVVLQLNQSLESVTSLLRRIIGEDIQLVVETDPNLYTIRADRNQIEQVLLNLAVNARDAMPNGGKLILRYANVSLAEPRRLFDEWMPAGDYVAMSVQDTGIGMSEELQAKIFEPFFTTKGEHGTGLGLATVHGIVRQSQGYIQVDSTLGKGTTFTVYSRRVDESTALSPASVARAHGHANGTETVLVVEDQEEVRMLMQHMLRTRGYSVLSASCGEEAVRLCREHGERIHLLLTDVLMPGLPVPKLVEEVIQLHPGLRVLYVSGYAQVDGMPEFSAICASENFLPKPFHPDEFLRKVRAVLDAPAPAGA